MCQAGPATRRLQTARASGSRPVLLAARRREAGTRPGERSEEGATRKPGAACGGDEGGGPVGRTRDGADAAERGAGVGTAVPRCGSEEGGGPVGRSATVPPRPRGTAVRTAVPRAAGRKRTARRPSGPTAMSSETGRRGGGPGTGRADARRCRLTEEKGAGATPEAGSTAVPPGRERAAARRRARKPTAMPREREVTAPPRRRRAGVARTPGRCSLKPAEGSRADYGVRTPAGPFGACARASAPGFDALTCVRVCGCTRQPGNAINAPPVDVRNTAGRSSPQTVAWVTVNPPAEGVA
jgi:hypothetical protein